MKREKVEKFLSELEQLSKKYGVWIENELRDEEVKLIDSNYNTLAEGLFNDEDTQEYLTVRFYV
jgi:hypothetical protein